MTKRRELRRIATIVGASFLTGVGVTALYYVKNTYLFEEAYFEKDGGLILKFYNRPTYRLIHKPTES